MEDKNKKLTGRSRAWTAMIVCGCGVAIVSPMSRYFDTIFLKILQFVFLAGLIVSFKTYWNLGK